MSKLSLESTLDEVLRDQRGREVLSKHLGGLIDSPVIEFVRMRTLNEAISMAGGMVSDKQVECIKQELFT